MRYLSLGEVIELHRRLLEQSGGAAGLRALGSLESAVAQPRMTFDGRDLYPDVASKPAALAFSLIQNHPFVDGNKRVGHAAMETFLWLNGYELAATMEASEAAVLGVASAAVPRDAFERWVHEHLKQR